MASGGDVAVRPKPSDNQVSDTDVLDILETTFIYAHLEPLCLHLGLEEIDISNAKETHSHPRKYANSLLQLWRKRKADKHDKATRGELFRAMKKECPDCYSNPSMTKLKKKWGFHLGDSTVPAIIEQAPENVASGSASASATNTGTCSPTMNIPGNQTGTNVQSHQVQQLGSKLTYADLQTHELIGQGGFGEVFRVTFKYDSAFKGHHQAAAKKLNRLVESEVRILGKVKHRNIVEFLDYVQDGLLSFIVMELADGSLREYLDREKERDRIIPESLKEKWVKESSEAIRYLHELTDGNGARMSVVHRDIKAANCLLFGDVLKVSDFGISRETDHTADTPSRKGTRPWMAPEVLEESKFSTASDIYALGVLYWEIYTQELPQARQDGNGNRQWGQPLSSIGHTFPSHLEKVLLLCWRRDYKDRPSIAEVIAELPQDFASNHSSSESSDIDLK